MRERPRASEILAKLKQLNRVKENYEKGKKGTEQQYEWLLDWFKQHDIGIDFKKGRFDFCDQKKGSSL
jgi:hypothetical protein